MLALLSLSPAFLSLAPALSARGKSLSPLPLEQPHFEQGLKFFAASQWPEAGQSFKHALEGEAGPSQAVLHNLALVYYKQEDPARAAGYWRKLLFQNPYSSFARGGLKQLNTQKTWWLWIPPDIILGLSAAFLSLWLLALYKHYSARFWLLPAIVLSSFAGVYFYKRLAQHATLAGSAPILSAPEKRASLVFKPKPGALLKIKQQKGLWRQVWVKGYTGWVQAPNLIVVQ